MGILNITPDSFSDGGQFYDHNKAINHAKALINQGADIIDIGGESTRPFSDPVSVDDELLRVIPVVKELRKRTDTVISIDTTKSTVAKEAWEGFLKPIKEEDRHDLMDAYYKIFTGDDDKKKMEAAVAWSKWEE